MSPRHSLLLQMKMVKYSFVPRHIIRGETSDFPKLPISHSEVPLKWYFSYLLYAFLFILFTPESDNSSLAKFIQRTKIPNKNHDVMKTVSFLKNWSIACIWWIAKWFSFTHTCTHILFHILFHYGLLQDIEHSSLCYIIGPCSLPILCIIVCSF